MTTTASVGLDQTAYERLAFYSLRPELYYDRVADVQPTRQSMPGSAVVFTIIADMAVASTALNESVDVDAIALTDSQVTVTLVEYGNSVNTTRKLRATSFIEVNPAVAKVIGYNAGRSIDSVAQLTVQAGSNVRYATGGATDPTGRTGVEPGDTLTAADVRRVRAELVAANVAPKDGNLYIAYIHPDVLFDLKSETGEGSWLSSRTFTDQVHNDLLTGEAGVFGGFRFIETPRAPVFADAGSSTTLTDVYATIFCGAQAVAKAYSTAEGLGPDPKVIMSPVIDKLERFQPISWYHLVGYGRFREAALRRVESSSSIGTNA
jgi:N4-gp56 family major capsid protein